MKRLNYTSKVFLVILFTFVAKPLFADELLYNCPFSNSVGDQTTRGFYVENYPGTTLASVVIGLASSGTSGAFSISLTAREGTYDGPLIGTSNLNLNLTGAVSQTSFEFPNAAVTPGATVTFRMVVSSDPDNRKYAYYDLGTASCDGVTQTNGTNPPLDVYRRDRVGLAVWGEGGVAPPPVENVPPVSAFTFNCTDLDCSFDGSTSSDSDGTVTDWDWDFGDGSSGTGENTNHSFAAAGSYNVVLTVTDDDGATNAFGQQLNPTVAPPPNVPPVSSFTHECTYLECSFDGGSSSDADGVVTTWAWDFGDGNLANGETGANAYTSPGTYAVILTVTDDDGATHASGREINVSAPPPPRPVTPVPGPGTIPLILLVLLMGLSVWVMQRKN